MCSLCSMAELTAAVSRALSPMPLRAATATPPDAKSDSQRSAAAAEQFQPNAAAARATPSVPAKPIRLVSCSDRKSARDLARAVRSAEVKELGLQVSSAQSPASLHSTSSQEVRPVAMACNLLVSDAGAALCLRGRYRRPMGSRLCLQGVGEASGSASGGGGMSGVRARVVRASGVRATSKKYPVAPSLVVKTYPFASP